MSGNIEIKPGDKGILYIFMGLILLIVLVYAILRKTASDIADALPKPTDIPNAVGTATKTVADSLVSIPHAVWQSGADAANAANKWYVESGVQAVWEPIDPFNSNNWLATDIVKALSNPTTEAIHSGQAGIIEMPNGLVIKTEAGDFIDPNLMRYWRPT